MAEDEDIGGGAVAPSPFTAQSVYPADMGATNPALAKEFLDAHRASMAQRTPEIDNSLSKMQLNVDSMTKMLDDTIASIRASKSGRSNLALMALGAGMLSSRGNFGQQLGAGLGAMVPTIAKQREDDDNSELQLAGLAMKKAALQQAPLEQKLAYYKAMQVGDLTAARAIEQALIRAQATSGKGADKLAMDEQKLAQKTVNDALNSARQRVKEMAEPMDWTADQIEAEQKKAFVDAIKMAQANGVKIGPSLIETALGTLSTRTGDAATRKEFFESPTNPEAVKRTQEAGLPAAPYPYLYDAVGRKEGIKRRSEQEAQYAKEQKTWDAESKQAANIGAQLDQFESLMDKKPDVFGPMNLGPMTGALANNPLGFMRPNRSPEAKQAEAISNDLALKGVPQGQGAWSEMERQLMAKTVPSMDMDVKSNKAIIGLMREGIKRDKDRREFFDSYFNNYRTTDGMLAAWDRYISSPAGTVIARDGAGNLVPNTNRMSWREFFRKERSGEKKAAGGPIHLGADYD